MYATVAGSEVACRDVKGRVVGKWKERAGRPEINVSGKTPLRW